MSKIIIENQSAISDEEVLKYVSIVIRGGRISNDGKSYCFATLFADGVAVYAVRNKSSDRLIVRGKTG